MAGKDCNADSGHNGCPILMTDTCSYGAGMNNAGGGVYAMEWTDTQICKLNILPRIILH